VEIFANFAAPNPVRALKSYSAISYCTVIGNEEPTVIANGAHISSWAFCFPSYKDWQRRNEKINLESIAKGGVNFF